jgi:hypothetical protein
MKVGYEDVPVPVLRTAIYDRVASHGDLIRGLLESKKK